jgi:hypothetical protein
MEIKEFVASGESRHQEILGTPAGGVAAEARVRGAVNQRLRPRGNHMIAAVAGVFRGAAAAIADPLDRDFVLVRFAKHWDFSCWTELWIHVYISRDARQTSFSQDNA